MNFLQQLSPEPPPVVGKTNGIAASYTAPIHSYVEQITPGLAAHYLAAKNDGNRNLIETSVASMMKDMAEGRWELTGQAIIFDNTGKLIDGHHRLTAISRGTVVVPMLVVRNASPSAVRRIDTGVARTAAHIAHMDGHKYAAEQTALARLLLIHERHGIERMNTPATHPTKAECVDEIALRPSMMLSIEKGYPVKKRKWATPTVAAFCHYLFYQQNALACDRFWDEVCGSGAGLKETSPALHLRTRLADNAASRAKLPVLHIIALFFKAWIAYRNGKAMRRLQWKDDEGFPQI